MRRYTEKESPTILIYKQSPLAYNTKNTTLSVQHNYILLEKCYTFRIKYSIMRLNTDI